MSEGNASVEVAALKAEINIDLDKFEEALDQAVEMFENFADEVNQALEINLHINDDALSEVESEVDALKDSLSSVTGGDISENINSEGSEETIEQLEQIKALEEEISNCGLDVDLTNDDIDTVIQQLEEVKAMQSEINDTDDTLNVNVEDIDNAIAQLQELKETEEEASDPVDINIEANGVSEAREEVEELGAAERETKEEGQGLSETLGTAIYAFQAVFQAVTQIAEGSLEQFAQLQMSARVAGNIFGSFGDNIKAFASTSMTSLGMSSGATMHYADMLGFALKAQGATSTSAGRMAEQLVQTADNMVLASGGTETMQQAVQVLTAAIGGQTFGLKGMGIAVTGVNKKWTPLHQSMYIMHQVMEKVNENFGKLSGNLDTTAGQMQIAKSTMEQFGESIGEVLAPQLAEVNKVLGHLYNDFEHLSPAMKKGIVIAGELGVGLLGLVATIAVVSTAIDIMGKAFEGFTAILVDNPIVAILGAIVIACGLLYESWKHNWLGMRNVIDGVIKDLTPVFDGFIKFMKQEFKSLQPTFKDFEKLWKVLKPIVEDVLKTLGTSIVVYTKMIVKEIEIVVKVVTETIKIVTKIVNGVIKVVEDAGKIIGSTIKYIDNKIKFLEDTFKRWESITKTTIHNIEKFFERLPHDVENYLNDAKNTVVRWGIDVGNFFTRTIPHWMDEIGQWFETLPSKIEWGLGYALGTLVKWGIGMYDYLTTNIPVWIDDIGTWFSELPGKIWTWLVNAYHNVVKWGENVLNSGDKTGSSFLHSIGNWFEQLPAEIEHWLDNTYHKVITWGNDMKERAEDIGRRFVHDVVQFIENLPHDIMSWLRSVLNDVGNWGSNMVSKGVSAMNKFANGVVRAVEALPGDMESIGLNIVEGLWHGLKSEWDGLMSWVDNAASNIVAGFKSALDIHSPSREMYREVGAWILPGISEALNDGMPTFLDNITDKVDTMVNHMSIKLKEGMGNIKVGTPQVNIPWGAPNVANNNVNTNNSIDVEGGNIQTTGVMAGQTNHFTINESNNASETANQVIHKLQLAHFGIG